VKLAFCIFLVLASCSASDEAMPRRITGPVTEVRIEAGEVTRFTVVRGAREYPVLIDSGVDYGFDLTHLGEHRTSGDPVAVELVWRGGDAYATSILDA
jgi:hypothetical protein